MTVYWPQRNTLLPDSFNITYNLALVATYSDVTEIVELDDEDESSAIPQTTAVF